MSELTSVIRAVCEEKGLEYDSVLRTIEFSLAAAYRKDFGQKNQNIKVEFNPETSETRVMDVKTVVEDLPEPEEEDQEEPGEEPEGEDKEIGEEDEEKKFNPKTEIQLSDAKLIKEDAQIGEELKIELNPPESYGRMAAQTAKQVIIQKLRESEREMIYNEFKEKEHEVVNGIIQRREGRNLLVDLGKSMGFLPAEEQIVGEKYKPGERIKVYIRSVELQPKGPRIILSRTSKEIVRTLFYLEIPELNSGVIEIQAIAREAGSRSKVAVSTDMENVDPIGSCVGQKGSRIQTIINELGGEKVDIIEYDEDPTKFIANALSPAKSLNVELDEKKGLAYVKVASDQFSLAIGRRGENIRLASALVGWKINVYEDEEGMSQVSSPEESQEEAEGEEAEKNTPGEEGSSGNKEKEEEKEPPAQEDSGDAAEKDQKEKYFSQDKKEEPGSEESNNQEEEEVETSSKDKK